MKIEIIQIIIIIIEIIISIEDETMDQVIIITMTIKQDMEGNIEMKDQIEVGVKKEGIGQKKIEGSIKLTNKAVHRKN